jgi:trans-aconitate methyltransferase
MVPCCGTFPEVELLIEHFPDREITGIDLSDGMVALARERTSVWPNVEVITGTRRHSIHAGPASAPPWCRSSSCRRWQAEV